jgi:uncharacterized protein YdbL (DUF1318 family)
MLLEKLRGPLGGQARARGVIRPAPVTVEAVAAPGRAMNGWRGAHAVACAMRAMALVACVPVTVNISFPQDKLDAAARQIEDMPAPSGAASPPTAAPAPTPTGGRSIDVTPRIDTRSPEVRKATEARRQRRPALRDWKSRGCIGESNQGLLVARPGEGCGPEVADLIRAENADRHVIYDAFMLENNIPASDTGRVASAFATARQERARPDDWIQLADGQWVRKR